MADETFPDIPLFREIQKLLSASSGPVNFEIARQIAEVMSVAADLRERATPDVGREILEAAHDAEALVTGYTRLALEEPLKTEVVEPPEWAALTLEGWRWLFEHMATRFVSELSNHGSAAGQEEAQQFTAAIEQVAPLLLGVQVGTLVGQLAGEALTCHDLPVPHEDGTRLSIVSANVDKVAAEYGFELAVFRQWLCFREVAKHVVLARAPWTVRYHKSLLVEVIDAMEVDVADLERRLTDLQTKGLDALQAGGGATAIPLVPTERHQQALDRLWSFQAALEGYASHAGRAVGTSTIGEVPRIEEGIKRHRASPSEGKTMLAAILGVSVDRGLESGGETFCAAVESLKGLTALNLIWEAPDNLPTAAEIRDPFEWMERVLA